MAFDPDNRTISETFKKASFDGIEFPVSKVRVRGGIRYHTHEFPDVPGGETQKLGRKLYTIEMIAWFHDLPGSDLAAEYPDLYPKRLNELQDRAELQMTRDLLIPNIGKIKAHFTDWDREFDFEKALSGEGTVFQFLEDQDKDILADRLSPIASLPQLTLLNDDLQAKARLLEFKSENAPGLFQKINNAITAVQAVQGVADAHVRLVEGKIRTVADLCSQADSGIEEMQNPDNHLILAALKDLWLSASQLSETLLSNAPERRTRLLKRTMSIGQVATMLYGDAERAVELMTLNPLEDPYVIPEGTLIAYVKDAA